MRKTDYLYILSNGKVAAIHKKDGAIVWEIKLKQYHKSSMMGAIGQIHVDGDKLYISISGILLCIYAKDGALVWVNELKGWGYSFVSIANADNDVTIAAAANAAAMAAAGAA